MVSSSNLSKVSNFTDIKKTKEGPLPNCFAGNTKKNAGCLLIKAFRQWFDGRRNWHIVTRGFRQVYGYSLGSKIIARLEELLGDFDVFAKRPLLIHTPGDTKFGLDEIVMHQIIASLQASQFRHADDLIENMVSARGHGAIADGFFMLANYFTFVGDIFPLLVEPAMVDKVLYLQAAE